MTAAPTLTIRHQDHPGQALVTASGARTRVIAAGRRWGKTRLAVCELMREHGRRMAIRSEPPFRAWCVAPTFSLSYETWNQFHELIPPEIMASISKEHHRVEFVDGSMVEWKSADDEKQLRGAGLDFLVVDEAARVSRDAWVAMRPAVMDREGRILLISTPKGMNWFYDQWVKGNDRANVRMQTHESWQSASSINPYLNRIELDEVVKELDDKSTQQEIAAMFMEDMGQVFRGIMACADGKLMPPAMGQCVLGLDIAKSNDFTVCCVVDIPKRSVVAFDRFGRVPWPSMVTRVANLARKYNALIEADATGLGEPIVEQIRAQWPRIRGHVFTNQNKAEYVTNLSLLMEQEQIHFPPIAELLTELKDYGSETLPGGGIAYHAPEGKTDDCVVALMLAAGAIRKPGRRAITMSKTRRLA